MNNDLISREALKEAIKNLYNGTLDGIVKFGIEKAYEEIDNAPAVVERPQGEWLHPYKSDIACECSNCHIQMPITDYFNFCPNCGTQMKGGAE